MRFSEVGTGCEVEKRCEGGCEGGCVAGGGGELAASSKVRCSNLRRDGIGEGVIREDIYANTIG